MEPEGLVLGNVVLEDDLSRRARFFRGLPNPVVRFGRLYGIAVHVDQVEHAIGDVQLVHRIDDAAAGACLHLSNACSAHQLQRGAPQRIIELLRQLVADHSEQPHATRL